MIKVLQIVLTVYFSLMIVLQGALIGLAISTHNKPQSTLDDKLFRKDLNQDEQKQGFIFLIVTLSIGILLNALVIASIWRRAFILAWSVILSVLLVLMCTLSFLMRQNTVGFIALSQIVPIGLLIWLGIYVRREQNEKAKNANLDSEQQEANNSNSSNGRKKPRIYKKNVKYEKPGNNNNNNNNDDNDDEA